MTQSDQQELDALREDAQKLHLCEFWNEVRKLEIEDPPPVGTPHVWRFTEVEPRLQRAAVVVPLEEAERRAVVFRNPGLGGRIATTPNLYSAYSLYNPGEKATVHRHTPNAGRIGLFGNGGYTTVEGEKFMLRRGDLILTPNWTWHDHGNEGTDRNIWFDILDVPLMVGLNAMLFDFDYREGDGQPPNRRIQTPHSVIDAANNVFAAGGVAPVSAPGGAADKRMFYYRWDNTRDVLETIRKGPVDPFEGVSVRLTDPRTGASAMPTIDYKVKLLAPGAETRPIRHTAHGIFLVMEGRGYTQVGDVRLDWQENDVFVVPNWRWHHHVNLDAGRDAVIYEMSEMPLLRSIGCYRLQGRMDDGGVVTLVA
jgi:gentisate 1,2-dioxygenase